MPDYSSIIENPITDSKELGDRNVFVINDISLKVPPSQISVQKEDLTYSWKTLRTKTTTKVPTGNGKVVVHITAFFPQEQLLVLHRLIVEFRHSPFCYIENRYLRETIVPSWPISQNMAFTMTSLNITPMQGSSNTWKVELDLLWFNYFPFLHNYLFREEWQTNFIRTEDPDFIDYNSYSIGWEYNLATGKRISSSILVDQKVGNSVGVEPNFNYLDLLRTGDLTSILTYKWSTVTNSSNNPFLKTIYEMQLSHSGIEFDLLPLPDNMMRSGFVSEPINSRIYVRFINLLQRDALLKNFNIDVIKDLIATEGGGTDRHKAVFEQDYSNDGLRVIGLHDQNSKLLDGRPVIPDHLINSWINQMLLTNSSVRFMFHVYQEVVFPQEWQDKILAVQQDAIRQVIDSVGIVLDHSEPTPFFGSREELEALLGNANFSGIPSKYMETARENTRIILQEFVANGLSPALGLAAIVNAFAESNLDNQASSGIPVWTRPTLSPEDPGFKDEVNKFRKYNGLPILTADQKAENSVGLFQLNAAKNALGFGMSVIERRDPFVNTKRIVKAVKEESAGKPIRRLIESSDPTVGDLIEAFVINIERPANSAYEAKKRRNIGHQIFGDLINNRVSQIVLSEEESSQRREEIRKEHEFERKIVAGREQLDLIEASQDIDSPETEQIVSMVLALSSDGWTYYDEQTDVLNVWKKPIDITIVHSNKDTINVTDLKETFTDDGIVLTNISGGLTHIVASIPVLSHEFPTQQHLGSIEPQYTFEFTVIDDQGDLEGISEVAAFVNLMRDRLQYNARKFRTVTDGWCALTDTFLTRLLGTYEVLDIVPIEVNGAISDHKIKKRTVVARSASSTIPGNPGTSILQLGIEETNIYEPEQLRSSTITLRNKEEARKEVLQALHNLSFSNDIARQLLAILIAQIAGANTSVTDSSSKDYGQFTLDVYKSVALTSDVLPSVFILDSSNEQFLIVSGNEHVVGAAFLFESLGIKPELYDSIHKANSEAPKDLSLANSEVLKIPLSQLEEANIDLGFITYRNYLGDTSLVKITQDVVKSPAFSLKYIAGIHHKLFSIADQLNKAPEFGDIPLRRIFEYYSILEEFIKSGNRLFAEEEAGGIRPDKIRVELYDLPFENHMWQSWQIYLREFATLSSTGMIGGVQVTKNTNYPSPDKKPWKVLIYDNDPEAIEIKKIAHQYYGIGNTPTQGFRSKANEFLEKPISVLAAVGEGTTATFAEIEHRHANNILVYRYMRDIFSITDKLDIVAFDLKNIVNGLFPATFEGDIPAAPSMRESLLTNSLSCGNVRRSLVTGNPIWLTTEGEVEQLTGLIPGIAKVLLLPFDPFINTIAETSINETTLLQSGVISSNIGNTGLTLIDSLIGTTTIGVTPNSPFKYPVNIDEFGKNINAEEMKVTYMKEALARVADSLLSDLNVLRAFGLEDLAEFAQGDPIKGDECYPDLELPFHPYYGDKFQVYPDFYMWNIYDDAGAFSQEVQDTIKNNVHNVIQRAYDSMHQISKGVKWDESQELALEEGAISSQYVVTTQMLPEGSDKKYLSGETSEMATPFAVEDQDISSLKAWREKVDDLSLSSLKTKDWLKQVKFSAHEKPVELEKPIHEPGIQYPSRTTKGTLDEMISKINDLEGKFGEKEGFASTMFGSRALFLNEEIDRSNVPELQSATENTNQERPPSFSHRFDPESLKKLATDSSKDLMSRKFTLRRAFPTFKLFFIEEDEFESRFLSFDDFYSYNAVKDFTVVLNRKLPADHAVITLQNVGGTLDGTRRNTIIDADYLTNRAKDKLEVLESKDASVSAGDIITADTAQNQPFGALILRPGLNIQLRCGFSNDPNNLHVLINGRVIDVAWNKSGDTAEIMVQSFGAELIQQIKGTYRDGSQLTYKSTHELLASMILEPEVIHFGRWEFGQLFQVGESKDYRLDFTDYSREGFLGRFKITSGFTRWISNHPILYIAGLIGWSALSLLPIGKGIGGISKLGGSLLTKANIAGAVGKITGAASGLAARTATAARNVFTGAVTFSSTASVIKPLAGKSLSLVTTGGIKPTTQIIAATLAFDVLILPIFREMHDQTIGRLRKYFTRAKVSLFLSPQDDNLYPPHPKDYMKLDDPWMKELKDSLLDSTSRVLFGSDSLARLFQPERIFDKRVEPQACQYEIISSTIWDIFYEMSLRHPGWIFAPRPYGTSFRYTMFFGIPSQRYWARPGSNLFISRANKLREFLTGTKGRYDQPDRLEITQIEFKTLYGEDVLIDLATSIGIAIDKQFKQTSYADALNNLDTLTSDSKAPDEARQAILEGMISRELDRQMKAIALKEYLRALEIRFLPFRNYHLLTSEQDIVWNGLISTEQAVTNAVDVTYYDTVSSTEANLNQYNQEIKTQVFKAHTFIPENQLRIAPIRYPNCKSYEMATRYGVGELLHRLREMYRGEIIVLGNPRIRPWDIAILNDTYNDIIGPVEIEQVVHTFSHETGFTTEIKPSAVVFANEISGYPLVTAMHLWAMAVLDIEGRYTGLRANIPDAVNPGILGDAANFIASFGAKNVSALKKRYSELFPDGADLDQDILNAVLNPSKIDTFSENIISGAKATGTGIFNTLGKGLNISSGALVSSIGLITAAGGAFSFSPGTGLSTLLRRRNFFSVGGMILGMGLAAGGLAGTYAGLVSSTLQMPSTAYLMGSPILFLQCLRNDAIVLVPLMKSGHPIVSGLSYNDPSMIWNHFRGELNRWVTDTVSGTKDMLQLYQRYGLTMWDTVNKPNFPDLTGEATTPPPGVF